MKAPSRRQRIAAQLADLKMPGALESLDEVLAGVDGGGFTAAEAIERLLAAQIALRNGRRLATAMRSSRLPGLKTLADFDFSFQPSIRREQIDSLHELGFLERKENIVFLGPPGVGKTHLAISLAVAAAESGRRILHDEVMAAALLDRLLHRCHIVNIRGNSYRMRRHMELSKTIHPTAARAADAERRREGGGS